MLARVSGWGMEAGEEEGQAGSASLFDRYKVSVLSTNASSRAAGSTPVYGAQAERQTLIPY